MDHTQRTKQPNPDLTLKTVLQTDSLCAGYRNKIVTGPHDIVVQSNTLTGIKATNGAGKTTLLKTIAGIIPPISGTVMIDGKNLQQIDIRERVSLVSIVLTERIRLNGILIRQLVGMGCTAGSGHFSFFRKDDEKPVLYALKAMGIEHLAEKPMSECSDGELQKAMIARALAQGSQLMLMDEPTAFLDYIAKEELFQMLKKLTEECNVSVLFSSHDIALMEKYADKIIPL